MSRFAVLLLTALAVAGCGSIPQPFRSEEPNALLDLAPIAGIHVPPVEAEGLDGAALSEAMAAALRKREVLAFTKTPAVRGQTLTGRASPRGSSTVLTWTLTNPDGSEVTRVEHADVTARLATANGQRAAAEAALSPLLSALDGPSSVPDRKAAIGNLPRLSVTVARAPGDGVASLTAAMRQALQRRGYLLDDVNPTHKLVGTITTSPAGPNLDQVDVAWRLLDDKGQEVGSIAQGNRIERGLLSGPWGNLAHLVADGGAEGVEELLTKGRAAPSF